MINLKNKKGMLSIEGIVVVIFAIVILALGMLFLKNHFSNSEQLTSQNECEKENKAWMWKIEEVINIENLTLPFPWQSGQYDDILGTCDNSIPSFEKSYNLGNLEIECYHITKKMSCVKKLIEDLTCQELEDEFNCWGKLNCDILIPDCDKDCDLYWMIKKGC